MSDPLAGFLAPDRELAVRQGVALPDRAAGAVLMADLSGFTTLVEAMANEYGPRRGAEELSQHLSRLYGTLTSEVHQRGGSVVTYIGDAMLCWFDDAAPVGRAARGAPRALAAAVALQGVMRRFEALAMPGGATIGFGLKVGVAAGPVRRFLLGTERSRRYDVLAGATVDRAVAAANAARRGEILVSAEALEGIGVRLAEWRDSGETSEGTFGVVHSLDDQPLTAPWPSPREHLTEDVVRHWLPAVVADHLVGESAFVGEFRSAIPVFVGFSGIDYDADDDAGTRLDRFAGTVLDVLERHGGELLQVITGDKGSHAYATFGVPVSHDGEEQRALAAALELVALARPGGDVAAIRVGLSRGRAFVGVLGAPQRRGFGVLGDPVNLAARLMGVAQPGQVLITDQLRAGEEFELNPLGVVVLKGRAAATPLFAVVNRRDDAALDFRAHAHAGAMIGRTAELARLTTMLNAAVSGAAGAALIEGEAGIGKSRLLAAMLERAGAFRVVTGWADAVDRRTAYFAWSIVLRRLLGGDDTQPSARLAALTGVLEALGPHAPRRAPLLATLLRLPIPDNELTSQMSGEVRANNTRVLLVELLAHVARERPLLIALEDLHWLDSASWALLREVRRQVPELLLVLSTRPLGAEDTGAATTEYRRLLDHPDTLHVVLGSLPPDDAVALACRRLGVDALPPRVARLVQERAEGHPFFTQELVLAMRDAGHLEVRDGRCSVSASADVTALQEYPDTVEGVVASRLDRLSADEQTTAKVASVIGRSFALRVLRDIHPSGLNEGPLRRALASLERLGIVQAERRGSEDAFTFAHVILQQVTYDRLLYAQRRGLHRAVAEWIEREERDALASHYAVLARHWDLAGEPPRTLLYLDLAGDQAAASFANEEVISLLSRAQKLAAEHAGTLPAEAVRADRLAKWSRRIADARIGIGAIDEGYRDMRQALRLLGRPEPRPLWMALALFGHMAVQIGHRAFGAGLLARRGDSAAALESAWIYHSLVHPYFIRGDWLGGLYANWYMANVAERYQHDPRSKGLLSRGFTNLGGAWLNIVHVRGIGDWYLHSARSRARTEGDLSALGWTYQVEGMVRIFNASLHEAREPLEEARRIYRELGDARLWEETTYSLATWHQLSGDLATSFRIAAEQLASARSRDDAESQLLALNHQALLHVLMGAYSDALSLLAEADRLLGREGNLPERVFTGGVRALALARAGEAATCAKTVGALGPLLSQLGISNIAIEGFSALAEAAAELGDMGNVEPAIGSIGRHAARLFSRNATALSRIHRARAQLQWGRLARGAGQRPRARRHWRRALALAERAGLPYESACARLELALLQEAKGTDRVPLAQARDAFARMGTAHELARLDRALRERDS